MNIDINSKRIKFIDHVYYLIYSALHGCDLTDTSIEDGIKIHIPAIVFPFAVPLNAYISSANVNDSSLFDNIIKDIGNKILYSLILVFYLEYYNLYRFREIANENILFVFSIKGMLYTLNHGESMTIK